MLGILDTITFWDWFLFALVLVATLLSVFYGTRGKVSSSTAFLDYMLMGRQLTLPMFIATLAATWYGGIFGVTRIAFEKGLYSFLIQGLFWYLTYVIFAVFIVPKIRRFEALTLPQLVTEMFGPWSGKLSTVFNFMNVLPISYAISLGIFLDTISGAGLLLCTALGLAVVICYAAMTGFRGIVYSDAVQFIVMYIAVAVVLIYSVITYGGYGFLQANLPASHLSLFSDAALLPTFVWGFIALSTLVDPNFYQRIFAAKSLATARYGILITTCIWITFDLCVVYGTMYARAVFPQLDAGNAYLTYGLSILPVGLKGLLLAGICATILSTLDSYLFIASTSLSFDLRGYKHHNSTLPHILGLVATGLLTLLMAHLFQGNIPQVWKVLGTYSAACLLLPVLAGYFLPANTIKDKHFVLICSASVVGVTVWKFYPQHKMLDELYIGVLISAGGIASVWILNRGK